MKPRKITNNREIDEVFAYAYSCRFTSTNVLTGETRDWSADAQDARHYFDNRRPHSGLWEVADMKFAFMWEGTEKLPNREVHRVQILSSGIPS